MVGQVQDWSRLSLRVFTRAVLACWLARMNAHALANNQGKVHVPRVQSEGVLTTTMIVLELGHGQGNVRANF